MLRTSFALAALAVAVTGCPTQPDTPGCACVERQDVRIIAITHGATQIDGSLDPFWSVVNEGITTAGARLGVQVEHYMPTDDDVLNIAMDQVYDNLVYRAIAEQPDGVILSIPSNDIVSNALAQLDAAGTAASIIVSLVACI
eukprot:COSAG02_NODE_435_length_22393_cov_18.805643_17_plen_142_part_00